MPDRVNLFRSNLEGAVKRLPDNFKRTLHSQTGPVVEHILFKSQSSDEFLDLMPAPQCLLKLLDELRLHERECFPQDSRQKHLYLSGVHRRTFVFPRFPPHARAIWSRDMLNDLKLGVRQ